MEGSVHVPVQVDKDEKGKSIIQHGLVKGTDNKYYYVICTNCEELDRTGYDSSVLIKLIDLLNHSYSDQEMGGICINPWSSGTCFIPHNYIGVLLQVINSNEDI